MAQKYMSYNKVLLTFTVPDRVIKTHTGIKNARYSKMRVLVDIKAQLSKLFSRESNIKYFTVIELGDKFSSPHLHCQIWIDSDDISAIDKIKSKIIKDNGLQNNRCHTSAQNTNISNIDIFSYVIKTYSKNLSDNEIWNQEIQKKRYRKHYGKAIRFYSKSTDKYSRDIYRRLYYSLGIIREKANDFLDFFINKFFFFNKRNLPKISSFCFSFGELGYILTRGLFCFWREFVFCIDIYVFAPCLDPPFVYVLLYLQAKILFIGVIMVLVYFIRVFFVWDLVYEIEARSRSPCWFIFLFKDFCYIILKNKGEYYESNSCTKNSVKRYNNE